MDVLKNIALLVITILPLGIIDGQAQIPMSDIPYQFGEELKYRVHYGAISAGEATITVDNKYHSINNKECYSVNVFGRTTGLFDLVLNVEDTWRTYIDKKDLVPQKFYRHIIEGNYFTEETNIFNHKDKKVWVHEVKRGGVVKKNKYYDIGDFTQDLVSGFYYIRTLDFNKLYQGQLIPVNAFFEDSTYSADIKYLGVQEIRTKFGKKKTHVFTPIIPNNDLFKDGENTVTVYFSADRNKIPLKIKADMFLGAVEVDIKGYSGLREKL